MWRRLDCFTLVSSPEVTFSEEDAARVRAACRAACGLCGPAATASDRFARHFDLANSAALRGRNAVAARLYVEAAAQVVDGATRRGDGDTAGASFPLHNAWVPFMKAGFALVGAARPAEAAP